MVLGRKYSNIFGDGRDFWGLFRFWNRTDLISYELFLFIWQFRACDIRQRDDEWDIQASGKRKIIIRDLGHGEK